MGISFGQDRRSPQSGIDRSLFDAMVADLKANPGRSIVVAGQRQPLEVHRTVAKINGKLGNVEKTVNYYADPHPEQLPFIRAMPALVAAMNAGEVHTLLILGGNPVYNAPADLKFAESLKKVKNTVHLALHDDETSRLCGWHLSRSHYLEAWGDARTYDGTVSIVQPMIEPLFDGRSAIEASGDAFGRQGGHRTGAATRSSAAPSARLLGDAFSEWKWKKALADGVVEGTAWQPCRSDRQ